MGPSSSGVLAFGHVVGHHGAVVVPVDAPGPSPERRDPVSGVGGRRLFAATYDRATADAERRHLAAARCRLLHHLRGTVVEIGAGTGANLAHYSSELLDEVLLLEPDPHMRRRLTSRLRTYPALAEHARVVAASAERLPVADGSADAVVSTLVLCSVPDAASALAEAARVLAPSGRLVLLEHVRAGAARTARWQDRLTPVQRRFAGGCSLGRDTLAALTSAGFRVDEAREWQMPGPLGRLLPLVEATATLDRHTPDPA